ncbi:hypothetical protein [Desulfosporosinus sp. Sb-LF]|uniref:hypothetical protein n=1 Tax=Desulfosporosinus sp. Sb-LF TaxID=2560027 RepID=UPI0011034EFF|nr:hypothetical protein [Desulfosporosinus sp. Sb-LF]TGE32826.1 hypothetical protein E4K68_08190 [Desulfosporosinus sp. Sb-LF]
MCRICLPVFRIRPSRFTRLVAQSLSGLLSDCLLLIARIAPNHPRLVIGDVACVLPDGISPPKYTTYGRRDQNLR